MWLTRISVKYPVFTIMMMLSLMVLGSASWQRMGVEEFPDVDFPFVVVYTNYPGASPEAVESEITKKLEDQINTISGLKQITSQSSEGLSMIVAEFNLDVASSVAAQDVRDKIAVAKANFRDEIEDPVVERYDPPRARLCRWSLKPTQCHFVILALTSISGFYRSYVPFLVWVQSVCRAMPNGKYALWSIRKKCKATRLGLIRSSIPLKMKM